MDVWQIEKNLADLVGGVAWEDSPGDTVLTGGAFVSADVESNYIHDGDNDSRFPFARVECDGFQASPDSPQRMDVARLQVHVVAWSGIFPNDADSLRNTDSHGGEVVTGGTRAASQGQGKTQGRGLDEIVDRIVEALNDGQFVDSTHGFQGEVTSVGRVENVFGSHFVKRVISIEVYNATKRRHYHTVRGFTATGGSGQVALAWTLPPARYDRYKVIVRRAAGTTAPVTPSSGTGVTLSGDLATSVTPTGLSAGTHSFSVFVAYDETHAPPSVEERYSEAVSLSATVT